MNCVLFLNIIFSNVNPIGLFSTARINLASKASAETTLNNTRPQTNIWNKNPALTGVTSSITISFIFYSVVLSLCALPFIKKYSHAHSNYLTQV